MRVIAGVARGRRLSAVPGTGTRPITDRAKEALFSILADGIVGARVLDLFAGTGGVGIEALSRGASWCDFVDLSPGAVRTVARNLARTDLGDRARVWRRDVFDWLSRPPASGYDLVYVAPPQYRGLWLRTLRAMDDRPSWLAAGGKVVVQIDPREEQELDLAAFELADRRRYGGVLLLFWRRRPPPPAGLP
jgi:16S rRNA (guanine966-N2)-methyltransferase